MDFSVGNCMKLRFSVVRTRLPPPSAENFDVFFSCVCVCESISIVRVGSAVDSVVFSRFREHVTVFSKNHYPPQSTQAICGECEKFRCETESHSFQVAQIRRNRNQFKDKQRQRHSCQWRQLSLIWSFAVCQRGHFTICSQGVIAVTYVRTMHLKFGEGRHDAKERSNFNLQGRVRDREPGSVTRPSKGLFTTRSRGGQRRYNGCFGWQSTLGHRFLISESVVEARDVGHHWFLVRVGDFSHFCKQGSTGGSGNGWKPKRLLSEKFGDRFQGCASF